MKPTISKQVSFTDVQFDTIICLNGELPDKVFFNLLPDAYIIAADGAANTLMAKGILPKYLVGDLDSVSPDVLRIIHNETNVMHYKDQEINDFEKCLVFANIIQAKHIVIVGSNGGLMEHTLNNWSVFAKYSRNMKLTLYENERYGIALYEPIRFISKIDETISLIPQFKTRISTIGLQWNLNHEILELGRREGARNKSISEIIELNIHSGSILFYCDARLPYSPILTES